MKAGDLSWQFARAVEALPGLGPAGCRLPMEQVQRGEAPDDFKPMPTIGPGVQEIRIRDASGAFRVIFVARFQEAIYVLHVFQKKTQRTAPLDIELARQRYRGLLEDRK